MMLISVAMCTYNGEKYLPEQLNSIAAQSLPPSELVICDDGSTDSTAAIINAFAATAAFPVRFIQNDQTLGSTRNFEKAITACKGELISLSDQDDVWYPEKLARQSALLIEDTTVGGTFSDADLIDEDSDPTGGKLWNAVKFFPERIRGPVETNLTEMLLKQEVVTGATLMFRSSLGNTFLPIDTAWVHDSWIALMLASYSRLVPVCEPLMKYRIHRSQQLGVLPARAVGRRWSRAKRTGCEDYLLMARQFEALRARWIMHPAKDQQSRLKKCDGKIGLLYLRASLPQHRLLRVYRVLREWRAYHRYAQGWKSIAKDLCFSSIH